MEDRCLTLREIVEEVGISRGSVHSILTEDLCMWRVSAKFISKFLTEQQKELRKDTAQDMLDCANNDLEFTKTVITSDETWVYGYVPETKFQSSQWKHPESPSSKNKTSSHQCESDADLFLQFLRHSASGTHTRRPNNQHRVLLGDFTSPL